MHESVLSFVGEQAAAAAGVDVLEVGSRNINGSARSILAPLASSYLGVDLEAGDGVDRVEDGENLPVEWADTFGFVVCCEVLEHCLRPWRLVAELVRVCRPGGAVLVTARGFNAAGSFAFHNPPDRWRFSLEAMRALLDDAGVSGGVMVLRGDQQAPGVFALARKFV